MTLRDTFLVSIYLLVILASAMAWLGEGTPFPAGITIIVAILAFSLNERQGRWNLPKWGTNTLGLVAAAAAVGEFLTPNIEARLLSGAHFLSYLTWIVLFQKKEAREYWWLGAFALLQVAVGAVLTNSGAYGGLMLLFLFLMLWTMAVGNVFLRAQEYGFLDRSDELNTKGNSVATQANLKGSAASGGRPTSAMGPGRTVLDRHGLCQDTAGRWIGPRFVMSIFRMAVLGVLFGVLIFMVVPRIWIGSGNPFLNTSLGAARTVTGFSSDIRLGHMGQILEDRTRVFRVRLFDRDSDRSVTIQEFASMQGLEEPMFRGAVLNHYEKGRWQAVNRDEQFAVVPYIGKPPGMIRQEYVIDSSEEQVIFAMRPVDLAYSMVPYQSLDRETNTRVLLARDMKASLQEYFIWSRTDPHADMPTLVTTDNRGRPARAYIQYQKWPAELVKMKDLADRVAGEVVDDGKTSHERAIANRIVEFLRDSGEYGYSLEMRVEDPAADPVEDFLFNTRQGHCEYYAAALALMLRTQKIPTRLVTGFKGAEFNASSGYYEVQKRHSHAWVEAWYDNRWQTLDAVPFSRDEEVRRFRTNRGFWGNARDSLSSIWSSYFVTMSIDRQQSSFYEPLTRMWDDAKSSLATMRDIFTEFGSVDPTGGGWSRGKGPWILGGVVAVFGLVRALYRGMSLGGRDAAGRPTNGISQFFTRILDRWLGRVDPARMVVRFYDQFTEEVARRGLVRSANQTQREFAKLVQNQLNGRLENSGLSEFPREVTELFYQVRFGDQQLAVADLERLEQQLKQFASALTQPTGGTPTQVASH